MPEAVLPIIIGEERIRSVVEATIVLPGNVLRVEPPNTEVVVERCRPANGAVFVSGVVVINIPFKTGVRGARPPQATTEVVCGDLRHCTAFIPFSLWTDFPSAQEGDECRILKACVVDLLIDRIEFERLDVTAEFCIRLQVTRQQTVDIEGSILSQNRFVTFPNF